MRGASIDLSLLDSPIVAHELFECFLGGTIPRGSSAFEPNLISCRVQFGEFHADFCEIDAKDTFFNSVHFYCDFFDNLLSSCTFRDVDFVNAGLRNTVFVDCHFENVKFRDCDLSGTTFKNDKLFGCEFRNCTTSNKLLEHCLLLECRFIELTLQEPSVLQNFGLQRSSLEHVTLIRPESGLSIRIDEVSPKTILESVSAAAFLEKDLNHSKELVDAVNLRFSEIEESNILHILSGLRHLSSFLVALYQQNRIMVFFLTRLFLSIHALLDTASGRELPSTVVETLEFCSGKLRKYYENLLVAASSLVSIDQTELARASILVPEKTTAGQLQALVDGSGVEVEVESVLKLNSPSLAALVSPDSMNMIFAMAVFLSARFRLEISNYESSTQKLLLTAGHQSLGQSDNRTVDYSVLVMLNFPKIACIKFSTGLDFSTLAEIRRMVIGLLPRAASKKSLVANKSGKSRKGSKEVILFLSANPHSTQLELEREIKMIRNSLRTGVRGADLSLEQEWAVDEETFLLVPLEHSPFIIHFSGHGSEDGIMILDSAGNPRPVSNETLNRLLELLPQQATCIVLNACYSESQARSISQHAPFVIGVSSRLSDEGAVGFSSGFYKAIAAGREIPYCFQLGVAAMRLCSDESEEPILLSRELTADLQLET